MIITEGIDSRNGIAEIMDDSAKNKIHVDLVKRA
jgi:hypothetical protein